MNFAESFFIISVIIISLFVSFRLEDKCERNGGTYTIIEDNLIFDKYECINNNK